MSSLGEIEAAVDALPPEEKRSLLRRLETQLAPSGQSAVPRQWPVPPPNVPAEELRRIGDLIEAEFSRIDAP